MSKQLMRRENDKWVAGVCSGIGQYLGINPLLIRILWIIFGLTGAGILVYLVLAIFLPKSG